MKLLKISALVLFLGVEVFGQGSGTVDFVETQLSVNEGQVVSVSVVRKKSNLLPSSVEYKVMRSTAILGDDYEMITAGVLQWSDGDDEQKLIDVTILNDADEETDEVIVIQLVNPSEGSYLGDSNIATITISGAESGSIGFALPKFITSEMDGTAKVQVSRRDGLKGAVLVDYEVRELSKLDDSHLGQVTHYRVPPSNDDTNDAGDENVPMQESKPLFGVPAEGGRDFIPQAGTLLFLDYQSSATIGVFLLPNPDGDAYPHTVLEMEVFNARPLTSFDEIQEVEPFVHPDDAATLEYVNTITPEDFVPEISELIPTIDPDRQLSSLRINDITGPGINKIWDEEIAPDDQPRIGFRFGQARYEIEEGSNTTVTIPIPVYRSAPMNESVEVRYMVGPNRGFMVDDPRDNWENKDPKENPFVGSMESFAQTVVGGDFDLQPGDRDTNRNEGPYTDTGDQDPRYVDANAEENRYMNWWGDEPRILPTALYGTIYFGDITQNMHNMFDLDIPLLNPGSDVPTPTGARDLSPSFNIPLKPDQVQRDFKVVTGRLTWNANEMGPKFIDVEVLHDKELEFNEDIIVVLYDSDPLKLDAGRDEAVDIPDDPENPEDPDDPDDPEDPDENQIELIKPGISLGVQYWATITIKSGVGDNAGAAKGDFVPAVNNDIYDMLVVGQALDTSTEQESERKEKIVVVGDFTSVEATPLNRIARLYTEDGEVDKSFSPGTGADGFINSIDISLFSDDSGISTEDLITTKYVIGGGFTSYNGQPRSGIARIEADGSLDKTFDPGRGIEDGSIFDVHVQNGNKILVVGEFTSVDGYRRNGIVRFDVNGKVDEAFDVGDGPDGPIYAVDQLRDGRIVIGGNFSGIGDFESRSLAVLNADSGKPDESFQIGTGVIGDVYAIDVTADSKLIIGGSFSEVNGHNRNNVAVLKSDGTIDDLFETGVGADGPVYSVKVDDTMNIIGRNTFHMAGQSELFKSLFAANMDVQDEAEADIRYLQDLEEWGGFIPQYLSAYMKRKYDVPLHRILIAGDFRSYNETRRMGLARLNPDGSVDTSFLDTAFNQFAGLSVGTSQQPLGIINSIAISKDASPANIYIGGAFDSVGGGDSRVSVQNVGNISKLGGGETWGPGELEFEELEYRVDEDKGSGEIVLRRKNGRRGYASAIIESENFPQGSGAATGDDIAVDGNADYLRLQDKALYEHYSLFGSGMSGGFFGSWWYSYSENFVDASYYDPSPFNHGDYYRALLPHAFDPAGPSPIARLPRQQWYDPQTGELVMDVGQQAMLIPASGFDGLGWQLQDGEDGLRSFEFEVNKDSLIEGNETVKLKLSVPRGYLNLGGEFIPTGVAVGTNESKMLIIDDDFAPGQLKFSLDNVYVNENQKNVSLSIDRVNGSNGTISVQYKVRNGSAKSPLDFKSKQGTLRFASGQVNRPITISLVDDETQELDEYFDVDIFNVTGGGKLYDNAEVLSLRVFVVDNDLKSGKAEFRVETASISETEGEVVVGVMRVGGSRGQASVNYTTSSITAVSGEDYEAVQGVVNWPHENVEEQFIRIPILDDSKIEEEESFEIRLVNPNNVILGQKSTFVVSIQDDDKPGEVSLGEGSYFINENGSELNIYVERSNGTKGAISVDYFLTDGTASSVGDFPDYVISSGKLVFADGQESQRLTVQILDDFSSENTEFLSVTLSNPTQGATLGSVPQARVNIIDDETVNVPAGGVDTFFDSGVGIRVNGPINVITRSDNGGVYLAGDFTVINGMVRKGIGKLDPSGFLDRDFIVKEGLDGSINDIYALSDGSIVVIGEFSNVGGSNRNNIAKINADGYLDSLFDPGSGLDGAAHSIIPLSDAQILVVGAFQNYKDKLRRGAVIVDSKGNDVTPWGGSFGSAGTIYSAVSLSDGSFVFVGDFEQFGNNEKALKVAKTNGVGELDNAFTDNFYSINQNKKFRDGYIRKVLSHPDGSLILVGGFEIETESGRRYNNILKISQNGELMVGASEEEISAAAAARVIKEEAEAELNRLQAELEVLSVSLEEAKQISNQAEESLVAAAAASEQANLVLVAAEEKASQEGATQEDIDAAVVAMEAAKAAAAELLTVQAEAEDAGTSLAAKETIYQDGLKLVDAAAQALDEAMVLLAASDAKASHMDFRTYVSGDDRSGKFINGTILDAQLQPDGKLIVVGNFTKVKNKGRNHIARFTLEGDLDPTINFELGANDVIRTLEILENYRILIGGDFTSFNKVDARYLSKIYGGINYGGGLISFTTSKTEFAENEMGRIITLKRQLGLTTNARCNLRVQSTAATKWIPGQNPYLIYDYVGFSSQTELDLLPIQFDIGEVFKEIRIISISDVSEIDDLENLRRKIDGDGPVIYIIDDLLADEQDEDLLLVLQDFEDTSAGPQSVATLEIQNNDSALKFVRLADSGLEFDYLVAEANQEKAGKVVVERIGATNRLASVDFYTRAGTARSIAPNQDYEDVSGTLVFEAGVKEKTITIPIIDDYKHEGVESIVVGLNNPKPRGSAMIQGPEIAELLIDDGDKDLSRSSLAFEYGDYTVDETTGKVELKVKRFGSLDDRATVMYRTVDLSAVADGVAQPMPPRPLGQNPSDYESIEEQLVFNPGENEKKITINIVDDVDQETVERFKVVLFDSVGSKLVKQTEATIEIQDREAGSIMFTKWNSFDHDGDLVKVRNNTYNVTETEGLTLNLWYAGNNRPVSEDDLPPEGMIRGDDPGIRVTVTRMEGVHGRILMDYATVDGTARKGESYVSKSGTLVMEEGQNNAHIPITILPNTPWTYSEPDLSGIPITYTDNTRQFSLNIFNLRKDEGEPDYIKPQFKDANWRLSGEITANIVVERQPVTSLYVSTGDEFIDETLYDGFHFERTTNRVRESEGFAEVVVWSGLNGSGCNVYWVALPSPPGQLLNGVVGHDWNGLAPAVAGTGSVSTRNNIISNPGMLSNGIELDAGSDYATPWYWTSPQNYTPTSANTYPFADGDFVSIGGTIAGNEMADPIILSIPIINNDEVDFPQEFYIALVEIPGDCGVVGRWPSDLQFTRIIIEPDGDLRDRSLVADEEGNEFVVLDNNPIIGESAAGSYDQNFNPHSQYNTDPAYNFDPGANNQVHAVASQLDGKVIIGGDFSSYNSFPLNRIGRVHIDGSLDKSFSVGTGADDTVTNLKLTNEGRVLVGGKFRSYNGYVSPSLVELNIDGSINTDFNVGTGFDGTVRDIEITDTSQILVAGDFQAYNNTNAVYIARLHVDGKIDHGFAPSHIPNGPVNALAYDADGSVVVVGEFTEVGEYKRNYIAKYKSDGRLDPDFESVEGADGIIYDVLIEPDGKIVIAGDFTRINYVKRNRIARLHPDGTVDMSFDPGVGFDSTVYVIVQDLDPTRSAYDEYGEPAGPIDNPDYLKIYAGGLFHEFDEVRRYGLIRLKTNGQLDTTFMDNSYNQFAGIPRSGAQDARNFIKSISLNKDKDLFIGGSFSQVGGGYSNSEKSPQNNITRIVGSRYGYFPSEGLAGSIGSDFVVSNVTRGPGSIGFESDFYSADEFIDSHFIKITREGGNLGAGTVVAGLIDPGMIAGTSSEGEDYRKDIKTILYDTLWPRVNMESLYNGGWMVSDAFRDVNNTGFTQDGTSLRAVNPDTGSAIFATSSIGGNFLADSNEWFIEIIDDLKIEGNERLELSLYQPKSQLLLGGAYIGSGLSLGRRKAHLTTIDDDFRHGVIRFSKSSYYTDERQTRIYIDLERVEGSNGRVSVLLTARDLLNEELPSSEYDKALGSDVYADYVSQQIDVTFEPEETRKSVPIGIKNDTRKERDEVFLVELSAPKGGAEIDGPFSNSAGYVYIVDDDYEAGVVSLVLDQYELVEREATFKIPVRRVGGAQGRIDVDYQVRSAAGEDELVAEGKLSWDNQETDDKWINFEVVDDQLVNLDQNYELVLSNPTGTESKKPRLGLKRTKLVVINDDDYGSLAFASADFFVTENGGEFNVSVLRLDGAAEEVSVEYEITDGTAKSGEDYIGSNGTLHFEPGQPTASFTVTILNSDENIDRDETVVLRLKNPKPRIDLQRRALLGTPNVAVVNIIDDELNNVPSGTIDTAFYQGASSDDFIDTIVQQEDGKIIIGGEFNNVNGLTRSRIARLNSDGQIDGSYNLGQGFDGPVRAIQIDAEGKAVVAGYFKSFNGVSRNGIARLNPNGALDETFNPGGGADNPVTDLAIQEDGCIVIVGDFTTFNGYNRVRVARLMPNGDVDVSFDPEIGPDLGVNSVDIMSNGDIIIGGDFKTFNLQPCVGVAQLDAWGQLVKSFSADGGVNGSVKKVIAQSDFKILAAGLFTKFGETVANRILRLNQDGTLDDEFQTGAGANAAIYELRLQPDGKIIVGGDFNRFDGLNKNAVVRLNRDGSVDPTINFGTGANGSVLAVEVRNDYKLILGGGFTIFDNEEKEHIVQIHGGIINTPGKLQFDFPRYFVSEKGTNATVQVVRTGGLIGDISANFQTLDGTGKDSAVEGLDYVGVVERLNFPEGEAIQQVSIDILDDIEIEDNEIIQLQLGDFEPGTEGLQSKAELLISSDDSAIQFSSPLYSVTEGQDGSLARIQIDRIGSLLGELEMSFLTATNGTAQAKADFLMVSNKVEFKEFETSKFVNVPILDDDKIEPIESVVLLVTNLIGNAVFRVDESKLNIIDNDFATGDFSFEYPTFKVREDESFATIGVVRTNGFTGIVEIEYELSDLTAVVGKDYATEGGKIVFADGDFVQYMDIPILDDRIEEGAEALKVRLKKATGDASILPPNFANLIILDDESEEFITAISGQGANGPVYSIEADRDGFLVSGDYSKIKGVETARLSYIHEGGNVTSYLSGGLDFNNAVYSTKYTSQGVLVGGLFDAVGEIEVNRLVKLDSSGNLDLSFNASGRVDSTVYDVEQSAKYIYVGGAFGLLRLSLDGRLDEEFQTDKIKGSVYQIALADEGIYLAGDFKLGDEGAQRNIARLNYDGSVDDSFELLDSPDAPVYSVLTGHDSILIAGSFVTVNGYSSRRIASLNKDGSNNDRFHIGFGFDKVVRNLKRRRDGKILVSGAFERWNDRPANRIALLEPDGRLASNRFNLLKLNGAVYSVDEMPGKLFAFGGSFEATDDSPYNALGVVQAFSSPLPPELALSHTDEGSLLTVSSTPYRSHVVEYSVDLINWVSISNNKTDSNGEFTLGIDVMRYKSQYFRAIMTE